MYTMASGNSDVDYDDLCLQWYEDEMSQTPVPYWGEHLGFSTPQYLQYINSWGWSWISRACPCDIEAVQVTSTNC